LQLNRLATKFDTKFEKIVRSSTHRQLVDAARWRKRAGLFLHTSLFHPDRAAVLVGLDGVRHWALLGATA
jgi:hypothetical protein